MIYVDSVPWHLLAPTVCPAWVTLHIHIAYQILQESHTVILKFGNEYMNTVYLMIFSIRTLLLYHEEVNNH